MSLILKQETAPSSPASGKATIYVDGSNQLNIKDSSGTVSTMATSGGSSPFSTTGNVTGGNILTSGLISATGNGTFGNVTATLHVGNLSGTGNSNVGNIGATGFFGSGAGLTSIPGGNVTGTVANATYAITAGSSTTAGTVTTAAQPNITSVGTLTSISVSGNANVGNLGTAGLITATGNITGGNINTAGVINATGNGTFGNVTATTFTGSLSGSATSATTAGTVTTAAQPNITSVGTLTSISVSGNANIGNIGTDGLISATGNVTGGNLVTIGLISATGNGTFGNVTATLHVGNLSGTGNSNVGNLGTIGIVALGNIAGGNIRGIDGITSGGAISATGNITGATGIFNNGLNVTGNISATGNINYQNVTNLDVGDPLIYIGANNTGNLVDLGLVASYNDGSYKHTGVARNKTNGIWTFFDGVTQEPTTVIDWANATYPTVKVGALQATTTISVTGNANVGNIGTTLITATGNIVGSTKLLIGTGSSTLTNPVGVFQGSGATYTQLAMYNSTGTGSADLVAYGNNGDDTQSWADIGFTGNGFNDANYTVTGAGDGYFFTQGNSSFGGNMVIATGSLGTTKDIIFATGGFLTGNIKARLYNANGALSVTGNVIGGNIVSTNNHLFSVATGISAAGSTQGTATAITKDFNVVSTVASGAGVVLPTAVAGMRITVINTSANALLVYPATGGTINSLALNGSFSEVAGARLDFIATTTTQWYTLNATYG